jgi:ATP-binding cassette, subfamily B (MDR/TAP), member 1
MTIAMFIAGFVIAFIKGWLMTLVTLASLPAIGLGGYLYSTAIAKKDTELQKEYSEAGGMAEQAIASIKTVKQLNGEKFEADKYAETLTVVTKNSTKYGVYIGIGLGSLFGFMLCSYGLGFWFGSNCVEDTVHCPSKYNGGYKYSAGDVLVIFFSILMAGFNFTQLTPAVKKMSEGRSADRKPLITSPENAIKPDSFKGVFRF